MAGRLARFVAWLIGRWSGALTGRVGGRGRYGTLALAVAESLYHDGLASGGWAADIGAFGPDAYLAEADLVLHDIALGAAQGNPPTP